jgi:hypothetical protein
MIGRNSAETTMQRRTFLIAAALCAAAGPALAADEDPATVIRELYRVHAEGEKTKKLAWMPPHRERFFTRRLGGLIARAYQRNRIDFDFIYDGQDFQISELAIQPGRTAGGKATVIASFKNFKEPKRVEYELVRENGAWRIAEIRSRQKPSWILTQVLSER